DSARDVAYRIRVGPDRRMEYFAGSIKALTGYTPQQFRDDPTLLRRALHPDDVQPLIGWYEDPEQHATRSMVIRWCHLDGRVVYAEHIRKPIFAAAGPFSAAEGLARATAGLIAIQSRLRESEDKRRHLAARLQQVREEERTHLARELHDELGQTLTAL